jgi:hypothetical protein
MSELNNNTNHSDKFGRALGALKGIPGVISTTAATVRSITAIVGTPQTFIVQTFRRLRDPDGGDDGIGDTLFIEYIDNDERVTRIVCPPQITRIIARQRDALTARARKRAAQAGYETRKANGTQATPPNGSRRRKAVKS